MKKRLGAGWLLVLCVTLLTACGSMNQVHMGQMHMGQSASPTNTGPGQPGPTNAGKVHITLSDFRITSSLMTFTAGMPYHFTVTNEGKAVHELMLMSTAMKTMNMSGMPMNTMNQMALASLEGLNPGETKTFDYTFVLSVTGPHPEFSCHLPGHYEMGMHLDITVRQ